MPTDAITLSALRIAASNGDTAALLAWADAVQETGDERTATMLRQFPGLRQEIGTDLEAWCAHYPGLGDISWSNLDGRSWWFCGDGERSEANGDSGEPWAVMMGQLMRRWNAYFPAVEWLIRDCGLPRVEVGHAQGPNPGNGTATAHYDLTVAGTHLGPIPDGHEVTWLSFRHPPLPDEYDGQ